ncbi:MAG: HD-GYP domain-containing protein [Spirochaetaceae bacterium]|nr:HD-GYP domain-containing protein [Spirochaetaceae bacterium]MCF7948822.1 HD-GYP domain-containing protein [Spirochaetia bacterium]MCF7950447.1 HD-GYP domain-containing protein [Spirochaetaceae bacterium]
MSNKDILNISDHSDSYIEDVEELESLEDFDSAETAVTTSKTTETEVIDSKRVLTHPKIQHIQEAMNTYTFPSVLLTSNLYILYENSPYSQLFIDPYRQFPRSLAQDFPHDLHTEHIGKVFASLQSEQENFSYRGRLQAIHRSRLDQLFNVNIIPIFTDLTSRPTAYQAFFDNVTKEQKELLHNTFLSLLEASKLKDNDTGNHIQRVGEYSKVMAQYLFDHEIISEIGPEFIHNIQFLAQMHDVGKIGTPDDILNKEGPLDEREWEIMQEHTINGAYIMSTYPHSMAREIALFHHEHWDGTGYPYSIAGDMIPLSSRIVAIADVYDALRMQRSYKEPFDHQKATAIITEQRSTHFDPTLVDVYLNIQDEFYKLYTQLQD